MPHQKGIGKIHQKMAICIICIMSIELEKDKDNKLDIIVVYAPNEGESCRNKDKFWDELNIVIESSKTKILLMGDFNARVGTKDECTLDTVGQYGEDVRNNNGKRLIDFCIQNELIITNTFYKHKVIHKYTREVQGRNERSIIIDYVIIEKGNRKMIHDTKVRRGPEISSDHFLVETKVQLNTNKMGNNKKPSEYEKHEKREAIKNYKLNEPKVAEAYEKKIEAETGNLAKKTPNMQLDDMWTDFKNIILGAAKETCGTRRITKQEKVTAWWSREIKEEIAERKEKWGQYLKHKTNDSYSAYKQQRVIVKRMISNAKKKEWEDFGKRLEENSKQNQKLFYRVLKTLRTGPRETTNQIKDKNGVLLCDETAIGNRWKEYFQELLECTTIQGEEKNEERGNIWIEEIDREERLISMEEIVEAIRKLKNGKAPGDDKITAEMMKHMGENGRKLLLEIVNKAWKEGIIPKDWVTGVIVPIFKKEINLNVKTIEELPY